MADRMRVTSLTGGTHGIAGRFRPGSWASFGIIAPPRRQPRVYQLPGHESWISSALRWSSSPRPLNVPGTPGCSLSARSTSASDAHGPTPAPLDVPRDPDLTEHPFSEMDRPGISDRNGLAARLKLDPQDPTRPYSTPGSFREFPTGYALHLRLFSTLDYPDPGLRRTAHLRRRAAAATAIRRTHRLDEAVCRGARRPARSRPHRALVHRHGPHACLRHPRRLRRPKRPRHLAGRSGLQAHRRPLALRRGPGQPADAVPLREPDQHRVAETASRGVRRSVHRFVRAATAVADLRPGCRGRSDVRLAATDAVPCVLRAVPVHRHRESFFATRDHCRPSGRLR